MMTASLNAIGDWSAEVDIGLKRALQTSVEVCGRTGEEACRHAIILMAQSARKLTPSANKMRPVLQETTQGLGPYVEVWNQGKREPTRVFKWQYSKTLLEQDRQKSPPGTWDSVKRIGRSGLAKKAWMWGLGRLGAAVEDWRAVRGASAVYTIKSEKVVGYVKQNRLSYLLGIMPEGWEATVESRVANKIMGQARAKLQTVWRSQMRRLGRGGAAPNNRELADFFKNITERAA